LTIAAVSDYDFLTAQFAHSCLVTLHLHPNEPS
jgi:hypothetical protein